MRSLGITLGGCLVLVPAAVGATGGAAPAGSSSGHSARSSRASQGSSRHLGDRTLRAGMHGHDVRVLQDFLTRAGYPTPVDGAFGSGTRQNVIAFQRARGLRPDGVVTPSVAQALRAAVATAASADSSSPPTGRARLNPDGTVTAPADAPQVVKEVIAAANRIAFKPYVYGGGHGSFEDSGYDCSGSVSYALHGGGLIASPEDSSELESYGSAGRSGRWITIWANSGHAYMEIAGLFFDTAAQGETGGDRWSAKRVSSESGYVVRHPTGY